jgi:antirestriction protein ArdC
MNPVTVTLPYNATTGIPYERGNVPLLLEAMSANGWTDPRFMTKIQSEFFGPDVARLKDGAVGVPLSKVFRNRRRRRRVTEETEEEVDDQGINRFVVYNVEQFDNLPKEENTNPKTLKEYWYAEPRLDVDVTNDIARGCLENGLAEYGRENQFLQHMTEITKRPSKAQAQWLLKIYARGGYAQASAS